MSAPFQQAHQGSLRAFQRAGTALLAITLLASLLRVLRLGFQPLWWDEGYSLYFATNPLAEMLAQTARDIHPPLYYALLHGWIDLFGPSPVAVRLLSVTVGVITVPLAYAAGRLLAGRRTGLLAAFLLAINPLHIFYSQEVRMYGLVALLGLVSTASVAVLFSTHAASRTTHHASRITSSYSMFRVVCLWCAYVIATTAALYAQYYAAFLPLAHTLFALWRWRRAPRRLARWLGAQLLIGLAFLPWLLYAAPKLLPYVAQKVVKDADRPLSVLAYFARHLAAFGAGHFEGPLARWWWLGLLVLPPIAWALWRQISNLGSPTHQSTNLPTYQSTSLPTYQSTILLLTTLLVPLALGFALNLRYPFFPERGERLMLLALPAFVLLAALALERLWAQQRRAGWLALGGLLLLSGLSLGGFYALPRYTDDDYRPLITRVQQQARPDDVVFCVFPWQVGYFRAYTTDAVLAVLSPSPAWGDEVRDALDAPLAAGRHLWFPAHLALGGVLEQAAEQHLLSTAYPLLSEWHGPNTRLMGFTGAEPQNDGPAGVILGGRLMLVSSRWGPPALTADNDDLAVDLVWQRLGELDGGASVALRLADVQGRSWALRDSEPLGGSYPFHHWPDGKGKGKGKAVRDRHALLVPPGTPPGDYELRLGVYEAENGRALDVLDEQGQPRGSELTLGTVTVTMPDIPPSPAQLPIENPQRVDLEDAVRFLGHSGGEYALAPGHLLPVSLFWQAQRDLDEDLVAFVQLLDREGQLAVAWEAPPGAGFPTSQWRAGDLLRTQVALRLPATLADGRYTLISGLFRAADKTRLRVGRGDRITLGQVHIVGRSHDFSSPTPSHCIEANFDGKASLVGYDLSMSSPLPHPSSTITLTLYWRAEALMDVPYTVFVHLLDSEGRFRGQDDTPPGGGEFPTTSWVPGEYLVDEHRVQISGDAETEPHLLEIGLYDPATSVRLPLLDEQGNVVGDRLLLWLR